MFNQLSSTISSLSVTVNQIEKKQQRFEKAQGGPPAKRPRYDDLSDEEEFSSEPEEGEHDSDDEIIDQIDQLLNQGPSTSKGKSSTSDKDGQWLAQLAQDLVSEEQRSPLSHSNWQTFWWAYSQENLEMKSWRKKLIYIQPQKTCYSWLHQK